jgi:hypothetical protein
MFFFFTSPDVAFVIPRSSFAAYAEVPRPIIAKEVLAAEPRRLRIDRLTLIWRDLYTNWAFVYLYAVVAVRYNVLFPRSN